MERIWFDKQGIAWKRVMRLAAIWAAVVALVMVLNDEPPAPPAMPVAALAVARPEPAPIALAMAPTPVSLQGPVAGPVSASSPAEPRAPSCEAVSKERDGSGKTVEDRLAEMDVSSSRKNLIERMARSAVEWHRAAALVLEPMSETVAETACGKGPCDPKVRADEAMNRLDALARLAGATADPKVYALAFNACNKESVRQRGTCQLVTVDQWARLDPGNALPWLYKMEEAARAHNPQGVLLALQRLTEAQRNDGGFGTLLGAVATHAGEGDANLIAAYQLMGDATGAHAASPQPSYQILQAQCAPALLADANRRNLCNAAAEVLINKADSLADRLLGVGLASKLGWPPEQMQAIRAETDALHGALATVRRPVVGAAPGCALLKTALASAARVGELGEIGAARQLARESGKSMQQLAREHAGVMAELGRRFARNEAASQPR